MSSVSPSPNANSKNNEKPAELPTNYRRSIKKFSEKPKTPTIKKKNAHQRLREKYSRRGFQAYLKVEAQALKPQPVPERLSDHKIRNKTRNYYRYSYVPQKDVIDFVPRRPFYCTRKFARTNGIFLPELPEEEIPAGYVSLQSLIEDYIRDLEEQDKAQKQAKNLKELRELKKSQDQAKLATKVLHGKGLLSKFNPLKSAIPKKIREDKLEKVSLISSFSQE